eukprot:3481775-Pyramimonas_sp.AAC.1
MVAKRKDNAAVDPKPLPKAQRCGGPGRSASRGAAGAAADEDDFLGDDMSGPANPQCRSEYGHGPPSRNSRRPCSSQLATRS